MSGALLLRRRIPSDEKKKYQKSGVLDAVFTYVILILVCAIFSFPVLWLVLASFSKSGSIYD